MAQSHSLSRSVASTARVRINSLASTVRLIQTHAAIGGHFLMRHILQTYWTALALSSALIALSLAGFSVAGQKSSFPTVTPRTADLALGHGDSPTTPGRQSPTNSARVNLSSHATGSVSNVHTEDGGTSAPSHRPGGPGQPSPTPSPTPTPTPQPTPSVPAGVCPTSGFFVSNETVQSVSEIASTLNVPAQLMTIYAGAPDWTSFNNYYIPNTSMQLSLAVGNITASAATQIGEELVAAGHANTVIRIMWEMNGNWYPWGVQNWTPTQYIDAYRSIQQGFAATPGNDFTYVWNLNAGSDGTQEFATYPGNAYVSNIGIDWYDQNGGGGAPASTIPPILSFAQQHGEPISFDEWGVDGVSNAAPYIQYIASVAHDASDHVAFQSYFDYGNSTITDYPADVSAYQQYFAGAC